MDLSITLIIWIVVAIPVSSFLQHTLSARARFNQIPTTLMGIRGFRALFESHFRNATVAFPRHSNINSRRKRVRNNLVFSEKFNHVLIDMNPLLHECIRSSRSDAHALTRLMKKLDSLLTQCVPTTSLVLALDGSPSAAKLIIQRKRRYSSIRSAVRNEYYFRKLRVSKTVLESKRRAAQADFRALSLTPGTSLMHQAEQALVYWAWQHLSNPTSMLSNIGENGVKVYISSSTMPGEGEVKLLDWIYQYYQKEVNPGSYHQTPSADTIKQKKRESQESIVLVGGDSDLVLEGLTLPLSGRFTHNVFVLLPDDSKGFLSISLWETTRILYSKLIGTDAQLRQQRYSPVSFAHILPRIRVDLVILFILTGNDYLPKLRGSFGFNKVYSTYLRLQRQLQTFETDSLSTKNDNTYSPTFSLINPNTLDFNLDFCIAFFESLAITEPVDLSLVQSRDEVQGLNALGKLKNFVSAKLLPEPLCFHLFQDEDKQNSTAFGMADGVVVDDESSNEKVLKHNLKYESDEDLDGSKVLARLSIGYPDDENYLVYELFHVQGLSIKKTKNRLAEMALNDLLGDGSVTENGTDDELQDDDENVIRPCSWELRHAVEADVGKYLYGLVWNIQTYQEGVCADYAFSYGKRLPPTANEIVTYFKEARRMGRVVGLRSLSPGKFSTPLNAALSCLAALPSKVKKFVPPPYCNMSDETLESIYASCISPYDNTFDINCFKSLCEKALQDTNHTVDDTTTLIQQADDSYGRGIYLNGHSWTFISKVSQPLAQPFYPPRFPSNQFKNLHKNGRIEVKRIKALERPRPRAVWDNDLLSTLSSTQNKNKQTQSRECSIDYASSSRVMKKLKTIEDVVFKEAYRTAKGKNKNAKAKLNPHSTKNMAPIDDRSTTKKKEEVTAATQSPNIVTNHEGLTALACLKQLENLAIIGPIEWTIEDADSQMAHCEIIRLKVVKGEKNGRIAMRDELVFKQERNIDGMSRQAVKQNLASLALNELIGPITNWSAHSFKNLKLMLK